MSDTELDAIKQRSLAVATWLGKPLERDTPPAVLTALKQAPGDVATLLAALSTATARAEALEAEVAGQADCLQRAYGREMAAYSRCAQRVFEVQTQVGRLNTDTNSLPFADCQNEFGRCAQHCGSCRVAPAAVELGSEYDAWQQLRHLVDVVWQHIYEDESVPSTNLADKLITQALETAPPAASASPVAGGVGEGVGRG